MKLQNIAPITELKRDAASLIERASEQRSPIVITQNGRATAVLQDVESFEQDRRAFALLKLALQGDTDIAEGRVVSRAEYKKRLAALIIGSRRLGARKAPLPAKRQKRRAA